MRVKRIRTMVGAKYAAAPCSSLPRHASPPVYKLSAHVALLSILFLRHAKIAKFEDAALVAEHGSWKCSQKDNARNAGLNIAEGMRV